jgi:glucose-6-phosphate 1-dehydrogenase
MESNPLADPLRFERRVPECAIVIFGANGDLAQRKLIPALYRLAYERRLPESFAIVGNSRTELSDDAFRDKMRDAVKEHGDGDFDEDLWLRFGRNLRYVAGDMKGGNPGTDETFPDVVSHSSKAHPHLQCIVGKLWRPASQTRG